VLLTPDRTLLCHVCLHVLGTAVPVTCANGGVCTDNGCTPTTPCAASAREDGCDYYFSCAGNCATDAVDGHCYQFADPKWSAAAFGGANGFCTQYAYCDFSECDFDSECPAGKFCADSCCPSSKAGSCLSIGPCNSQRRLADAVVPDAATQCSNTYPGTGPALCEGVVI
jgi:hypothetical protein